MMCHENVGLYLSFQRKRNPVKNLEISSANLWRVDLVGQFWKISIAKGNDDRER
jgi:hypothetical protein